MKVEWISFSFLSIKSLEINDCQRKIIQAFRVQDEETPK